MLADLLRTDGHRFRTLKPLSNVTNALRALVRVRDDLVAQRVAAGNQLRCPCSSGSGPAPRRSSPTSIRRSRSSSSTSPTPASAAALGEKRLNAFMARHAYCSPAQCRRAARSAAGSPPRGAAGDLEAEGKGECVRALVAVLRPLVAQIATLTAAVEHAVEAHPDGKDVTSLFHNGHVCGGPLLVELGDDRARFASAEHLAAERGVALVTRESGKHVAYDPTNHRAAHQLALRTADQKAA